MHNKLGRLIDITMGNHFMKRSFLIYQATVIKQKPINRSFQFLILLKLRTETIKNCKYLQPKVKSLSQSCGPQQEKSKQQNHSVKEFFMVNLETRSDKINFQHTLIKSQREARKLSCATSYQIKFQIHIKTASTEILITQ